MRSIKEDIAVQIKDFRSGFQQRSDETKQALSNLRTEVREMQAAINRTREDVSAAEQRINKLEKREVTNNQVLVHLLKQKNDRTL